jgi:DNA-binding beta-propeller fold protein YncE
VDTATGKLARTVALPGTPSAVAVDAAGRRLFAALYARSSVAIVDLAGGGAPVLVRVASHPVAIAVARGSSDAFAYSVDTSSLSRLAATGRVLGERKIPTLATRTKRALAGAPALRAHGRNVIVTLPLLNGALDPASLVVSNRSIADGAASLELWQGGIGTHAGPARTAAGLTVHVVPLPGRLKVKLTSASRAFTSMSAALGADGKSLVVTLVKPPPKTSTAPVTPSQPRSRTPAPSTPKPQATTPGITVG